MAELRAALAGLHAAGVALEDPGDEIGPEAPGSGNLGLWFVDPDGYRWELSVQNGARKNTNVPILKSMTVASRTCANDRGISLQRCFSQGAQD